MADTSVLKHLGISAKAQGAVAGAGIISCSGPELTSYSPIDEAPLGTVITASGQDYEAVVKSAQETALRWRLVPAPVRGQMIREIGDALRKKKSDLGKLVTLETGKILSEGEGEVQEAIDIADFAVGLSRQLYGLTMHSERPQHRMYEQWHPLGAVGVITAFNFPVAVWAWNAFIAAVCGNVVVWKPSDITPLCALAVNAVCEEVAARHGFSGVFNLVIGSGIELGARMASDRRFPLVSATGSCTMGRAVGSAVAQRLGRSLLELGGNNAVIVLEDADVRMAVRSTLFGAVGTAGQRCTSTRRVLIQQGIFNDFVAQLIAVYRKVKIGNPLETGVLMGPLVNERAVSNFRTAIGRAKAEGGEVLYGGEVLEGMSSRLFVQPTIIKARAEMEIVREETFAPIVYVMAVRDLDEAIHINNAVPQGLSSAVFTLNVREAEKFLSTQGSDCGIANVNIGTSGAEIGGAFGGEKDTGGGRESGSDSWKSYMRRQTNTINYGTVLPLAQGVSFEVDA